MSATPTQAEIDAYEAARQRAVQDYQSLKAFMPLAAPTNAQSVAALKALIRIVRLVLGDVSDIG